MLPWFAHIYVLKVHIWISLPFCHPNLNTTQRSAIIQKNCHIYICIYIERANESIKIYEILRHDLHWYKYIGTKTFQLSCVLVNFQDALLQKTMLQMIIRKLMIFWYVSFHPTEFWNIYAKCCNLGYQWNSIAVIIDKSTFSYLET